MEAKRLIPYSVHLREDIYDKLKAAAGERKASSLVRDAITMLIEGDDAYTSGYNKALQDCIKTIDGYSVAKGLVVNGHNIQKDLVALVKAKVVVKEKSRGTKKTRGD
jgi:hypothetical protein